ncbi:S2-RNase [Pyrus ussuriensis x Pyrus communis]|uniref:S2-RNase n=1 Tax=Pyrus ussuriensis x Pyrus communis TaxID=2448454 RepID=A0A5N5HF32_9ROSA|nr:S2-RNase [Pyrus ussuriensis x Pyrus communis]
MMGYKAQVVASAIALSIRRKIENGGWSTTRTVDFRGLKPPHTMGNESFKMVVVALKKSTGVGRNRPWKIGGRNGCGCV